MPLRSFPCSALLCAALLSATGCGDSPVHPVEANAQSIASDAENHRLLLTILQRLDSIEARIDRESAVLMTLVDSAAAEGSLAEVVALTVRARQGGPGGVPQEIAELREVADATLALVESHTVLAESHAILSDSIMALNDYMARDQFQGWQGLELCAELAAGGNAALVKHTEARAEGDAGIGVKPWDTGALGQVSLKERLVIDFGAGAELQFSGGGCFNVAASRADPPIRPDAAPAALAATGLQQTLLSMGDRLNFDESSVDAALTVGIGVLESGDLSRLPELRGALPLPPVFANPVGTLRNRLADFDPVGLLCDGGGFGESRIADRATEACDLIRADDLPELGTFVDLDLGALGELTDSCGGRGLTDCMAALDNRISNVCSTSGSLRSKLAAGIFHSNDDFRLRLIERIFGSDGNDNVRVTGVPSTGWNCGRLIRT